MLLGVVGRATLASFGSPLFWLDRLLLGSCLSMGIFKDRRQIDPASRNDGYGTTVSGVRRPFVRKWHPVSDKE
jgi:hypothetical protein